MRARLALVISAVAMILLGGVLIGLLGLRATPIRDLVQDNNPVLFALGGVTGGAAWAFCIFVAFYLCSEMIFVAPGNDRLDSLNYLLSALLMGTAGDLKIVDKGEVRTFKQRGLFASFSTPGYVIVNHGNAVVFERNGKPSRVGYRGFAKTNPFETIHAVVDLALQQRQKQVVLSTKDGIPLQTEIRVHFQIHAGWHKATSGDMYPVLEQAVLNAVYTVPDWKEYTIETAVAMFRSIIAERYLHEIYDPLKRLTPENGKPKIELRALKNDLQTSLAQEAFGWGVKIQNIMIDVKPPKGIEEQALAFEKARMEQEVAVENANAETVRIKQFMAETGGTVADYALLNLCKNVGRTGSVPIALDQLLSDAFARANLRTAYRQQTPPGQTAPPQNDGTPRP